MLGSGAARRIAKKIFQSAPGLLIGALLVVGSAPAEAQTVPPPAGSAACAQNASAGALACGGLSSAVGASSTAVGEQATAGGAASSPFANARTTAFGAGRPERRVSRRATRPPSVRTRRPTPAARARLDKEPRRTFRAAQRWGG